MSKSTGISRSRAMSASSLSAALHSDRRRLQAGIYISLSTPTSMSACISHGRGYTCIYICIYTDRRHSHAVGDVFTRL